MLYVAMYVYASNRVTVTIICKVKQTARVAGNTEDTDACVRAIGSKLVSSLHNTVFKILLIKKINKNYGLQADGTIVCALRIARLTDSSLTLNYH